MFTVTLYDSVNFANTGNPNKPHNPNSLLSNVDWQPWGSSADHPLLSFIDPAPEVSITFDDFRVPAINLLNNIFVAHIGSSMDEEAVTVDSDDIKSNTGHILRSEEEL